MGDYEAHAVNHPLLYSELVESRPSFHLPLFFLFGFQPLGLIVGNEARNCLIVLFLNGANATEIVTLRHISLL